jgi:hypothetical protein
MMTTLILIPGVIDSLLVFALQGGLELGDLNQEASLPLEARTLAEREKRGQVP